MRILAAAAAAVLLFPATAAAKPWVVRATRTQQVLGDFNISARPTLRGVTDIYGPADDCTLRSWFGLAVWRTAAFRIRLTTLGGLEPGTTFCTDPGVRIATVTVTGKQWHTMRGLFIGDSAAKFHRLYPRARRFREGWAVTQSYERCVIGICPHPYAWVTHLSAAFRNGRVVSFVFPVGAQGE